MNLTFFLTSSDPPSPAEGWLVVVVALMFGAIFIWASRRQWQQKNPNYFDGPRPPWLMFGEAFWHGIGRSAPLLAAWSIFFTAPIGFALALAEPGEGILWWAPWAVTGAAFVLLTLLTTTVHFFNFPKWVVPPHRRAEPGAIREWRNARRERRQEHSTADAPEEPTPPA